MKRLIQGVAFTLIIGVAGLIALYSYVLLSVDSTQEIHRGTLWGEILLRSRPIRDFPPDLISGEMHYFYSPGEPTGKTENILLIRVERYEESMIQKCQEWFVKNGFSKQHQNTANTIVCMRANDGREAQLEVQGNDIVISVQQ